jgi:hypothetical protein
MAELANYWRRLKSAVSNDDNNNTLYNQCKNMQAEIFQEDADYCLDCWQERAYANP